MLYVCPKHKAMARALAFATSSGQYALTLLVAAKITRPSWYLATMPIPIQPLSFTDASSLILMIPGGEGTKNTKQQQENWPWEYRCDSHIFLAHQPTFSLFQLGYGLGWFCFQKPSSCAFSKYTKQEIFPIEPTWDLVISGSKVSPASTPYLTNEPFSYTPTPPKDI